MYIINISSYDVDLLAVLHTVKETFHQSKSKNYYFKQTCVWSERETSVSTVTVRYSSDQACPGLGSCVPVISSETAPHTDFLVIFLWYSIDKVNTQIINVYFKTIQEKKITRKNIPCWLTYDWKTHSFEARLTRFEPATRRFAAGGRDIG